jgi:hypothetical protein
MDPDLDGLRLRAKICYAELVLSRVPGREAEFCVVDLGLVEQRLVFGVEDPYAKAFLLSFWDRFHLYYDQGLLGAFFFKSFRCARIECDLKPRYR